MFNSNKKIIEDLENTIKSQQSEINDVVRQKFDAQAEIKSKMKQTFFEKCIEAEQLSEKELKDSLPESERLGYILSQNKDGIWCVTTSFCVMDGHFHNKKPFDSYRSALKFCWIMKELDLCVQKDVCSDCYKKYCV